MPTELKIPAVGESITEVEIGEWRKSVGDPVTKDEPLVIIESEKANVDLAAPAGGVLSKILKQTGETAAIGDVIAYIDSSGETRAPTPTAEKSQAPPAPEQPPKETAPREEQAPRITPAAQRLLAEHQLRAEEITPSGPGGRLLKEDVLKHVETKKAEPPSQPAPQAQPKEAAAPTPESKGPREEEAVPMSRLRRTLAERLVHAQQSAALLTTFNEADMSAVMHLRKAQAESFLQKYGVKLGFMSFFIKASVDALKAFPQVNAEIRGTDIIYKNYYDIGIAVGGGKGLVVPVLRNAERMSFAEIELAINDFAKRAKDGKLKPDELQGGTFTISNGGVYGSLLSTPIVNPPQSGILGMHAIQDRPVAREGNVVIRPMMYLALTYDHRVIDGREAVGFLRRIKEAIEEPVRMLLEV